MVVRDFLRKVKGKTKMTTSGVKCEVFKCSNGHFGIYLTFGDGTRREYRYLTRDGELAADIADKINRLDVSPCHIDDVIEDLLG